MRTTNYYKVKPSVAVRAGVADVRYRTEDGMMILNEQDMRMTRLEPMEYLTGVVEAVLTEEQALMLIEQGGRKMGIPPAGTGEDVTAEEQYSEEDVVKEEPTDIPTDEEATGSEESEAEPIEEEVTNE